MKQIIILNQFKTPKQRLRELHYFNRIELEERKVSSNVIFNCTNENMSETYVLKGGKTCRRRKIGCFIFFLNQQNE